MKIQLQKVDKTKFTENPDLNWASKNITSLMNQYIDGNYIAVFSFLLIKAQRKGLALFR